VETERLAAAGTVEPADVAFSDQERASSIPICSKLQRKHTLYDYQLDIIDEIERLEHPLVPLPTGAGKTVIAAASIRAAVDRGERVLFVVHRRELVIQASRKLLAEGIDHAILMGSESTAYIGQPVVIASIQTLHARAFRSKKIDLPSANRIFFDEAHHCRANTYIDVAKAYPNAKRIGLTATPARGDGRGLGGDLFTDLVKVPTYAWLIEQERLVKPTVFAPVIPDLKGVATTFGKDGGDYAVGQLEERMNTNVLVGGIVEHWHKLGENRPTICFTVGVKHSVHLRDEFRESGVAAEHIDAKTPLKERERIIADFKVGKVKILCNCMIFTEGFDVPAASCLILARPTKLLTMYKQMAGRVLRPDTGKTDAIVLDHSGAVYRHGYPDDDIEWVLKPDESATNDSAAKRGSHKELCECPACHAVRISGEVCSACGWEPPAPKPRYLEVSDGDLGRVKRDRSVQHLGQDEQRFHRELMHIVRARGQKPGRAAHLFKEKFKQFPLWSWNDLEPLSPSPATVAWVRSRAIAYAKLLR
jgi:superfamily II DNA or RNA helicase